jgi:hypothetical protein
VPPGTVLALDRHAPPQMFSMGEELALPV